MPVFRRGQEIVAQRCSDIASRHLYGQALTIAAANCRADLCETLLESNLEYNLEELTSALNSVSVWASAEVLQSFLKHDTKKVLGIQQYSSGLSHAARENNSRAVVYWLEKHPEHDNLAVDPATVIDVSANGFLGVLIPLMNHIRRQDSFERTLSKCLQVASKNGHNEVVEYLIDLSHTARKNNSRVVAYRLKKRGIYGLTIIKALLGANLSLPSFGPGKAAALNKALSFFGGSDGKFKDSSTVAEVMNTGPGAVVKFLLANLAGEKAVDSRYCHLAQMACMVGDTECIDLLLQRGMDVNFSGYYYGTALQAASRVGNVEIVERLLESGAEVDILKGVHGTPLRAAVLQGHEDLVRMLITQGADANLSYKGERDSILHLALGSRNHAIFKLLLDAGADVDVMTTYKQHVLILACKHGDATLVELLLARGVDVSVSGTKRYYDRIPYEEATPLHAACANNHLPVVQLLVDHGADIEKTNESSATPLIAAIRANDLSVIHLLLDAGADVNHAVDVTPLSEAAEKFELEIIEELLSAGAIIGGPSTKQNALASACRSRQHIVTELLLANLWGNEYEVEILDEALSAAIERGDREMVHLLLENGVPPSFKMLRRACGAGVVEVVRMLVDTGINVNEDDGEDAPLLHVAACHSRPDVVQFLIRRGANTTLRSARYGSPLIAALEGTMAPFLRSISQPESCRSHAMDLPRPTPPDRTYRRIRRSMGEADQQQPGYKEVLQCEKIVRILFDAGAEMDTTIRKFGNALHLASYMGSEDIVRQLLEGMEDVNIIGGFFESPLIAGLKGDHPTIVDLLLDCGSEVNQFLPEHGSALHYACGHGSKGLTQSLLDHGEDINAYDDKHGSVLATALHSFQGFSISSKQLELVDLLLYHEPKVQIRECDLLAAASLVDKSHGQHLMYRLFRHDTSVVATEAVIVKTIQSQRDGWTNIGETIRLLLEHADGLGTTPAMFEAAEMLCAPQNARITKILRTQNKAPNGANLWFSGLNRFMNQLGDP